MQNPLRERPEESVADSIMRAVVIAFVIAFGFAASVYVAWWAYDSWYIATHCTMVLGTRVCQ